MALIDVTKESLTEVIANYLKSQGQFANAISAADFILNYYTPVVPSSSTSAAFMIKDVISGEIIPIFTPYNSEKKCREMKQRFFPTAQYKVVKLYEAAE